MSEWNLELSEKAKEALSEAMIYHPHLRALIGQHLHALLNFPPKRWYRVQLQHDSATFFPEPGQKARFTGLADFKNKIIKVTHFSAHE